MDFVSKHVRIRRLLGELVEQLDDNEINETRYLVLAGQRRLVGRRSVRGSILQFRMNVAQVELRLRRQLRRLQRLLVVQHEARQTRIGADRPAPRPRHPAAVTIISFSFLLVSLFPSLSLVGLVILNSIGFALVSLDFVFQVDALQKSRGRTEKTCQDRLELFCFVASFTAESRTCGRFSSAAVRGRRRGGREGSPFRPSFRWRHSESLRQHRSFDQVETKGET